MADRKGCLKFFFMFVLFTVIALLFLGLITAFIYVSTLPSLEELTPSPMAQTSKIYSLDGTLITEFHAGENREIITFNQMSPYVRDAIVSVEDKRFYDHQGVDYIRIIGAAIADIRAGALVEGASTITQQFVKNVYLTPERTWTRKIREATIAIQLERHYTKDKILEMYLNTIYFGAGTYGVEKASQVYFGVNAGDLTLDQAALLAGLVRSPENYSPFNNMDRAKNRRNLVLTLMYEQDLIEQEEYLQALAAPIEINEERPTVAPSQRIAPYFIDHIKKELYDHKFTDFDVFKGGLRIYTTLDLDKQRKAEQAVKNVFPNEIGPSYSLISTDPSNGYIYALIGGKDYGTSQFNIATQGKRQPGSVFKVMVLAEALRQNIPLDKTYNANGPITIELPQSPAWQVDNYGGRKFDHNLNIIEATALSVNVVYAQLVMEVGASNVQSLAEKMDIHDIGGNPAIALGGLEIGITPLDISKIFQTFASGGIYHEPVSILKITDAQGNALYEHQGSRQTRIIEENYAYQITQTLVKVIQEGTGRAANIGRPAAGKTGTTSDHRDAWFAGYTPDLVTVVWMGYPDSTKPMEPIDGRSIVGGSFPSDIWREFMSAAHEGLEPKQFPVPGQEVESVEVIRLEIPNLVGRNIEEAREIAMSLELGLEEINEYDEQYPENTVFAQDPQPGTIIEFEEGQLPYITVRVSKGLEVISMPSLLGMEKEDAERVAQDYGFQIGHIVYGYSQDFPIDRIYDQDPKPEVEIGSGTLVTIYISKGDQAQGNMPDVVTLTEEAAITKLLDSGYKNIAVVHEEGTAAIGTVFNQMPESGTIYDYGAEVTIWVSMGVQVPDVTGIARQAAINRLEAKGLKVEIKPSAESQGSVIAQDPAPGSYINLGSTVIITLEGYEELPEEEDEGDEDG